MNDWLQYLNIALTSGVFLLALKVAFHHGILTQKVEDHDKRIGKVEAHLWKIE